MTRLMYLRVHPTRLIKHKRAAIVVGVIILVMCFQLLTDNRNVRTIPELEQNQAEEKANVFTSLGLLDPDRNLANTRNMLNKTFTKSGYPRMKQNQSVNWAFWKDDIIFQYPSFTLPEPSFISEQDKKLFYAHAENRRLLRDSNLGAEKLLGVVRIMYGAKAHRGIECGWNSNLMDFIDTEPVVQALPTGERNYTARIVVPILTPDSHSFQHFLDGVLPKIIQVLPFLRLPNIKLALQKPRDKVIKRMLAKMALYERVIWVDGSEVVRSEVQINTCITPPVHPLLWAAMRRELGVSDNFACADLASCKIILLNRAQSHNGGRNIKNQRDVIRYLSARYGDKFTVFKPQSKLAATKRLFSQARLIIGVHGGALYNLNFAPKQSHVIEVMPTSRNGEVTRRLAHTVVWQMSSVIGQQYWRVPLTPIDDYDNVMFPVDKLSNILDKVDDITAKTVKL